METTVLKTNKTIQKGKVRYLVSILSKNDLSTPQI